MGREAIDTRLRRPLFKEREISYQTSGGAALAERDAPRIAIKRPGATLTIEVCDGEQAAREAIAAAIGKRATIGGLTLATAYVDGRLTYIRMLLDDDGFQKTLVPNFPYPHHPSLDVPGVAVFRKWVDIDDESLPLSFSGDDLAYLRMVTTETPRSGFRLPVAHAGWARQSVFGYDPPLSTWFAQLTPDTESDDDSPAIWLGTMHRQYPSLDGLCAAIATALRTRYAAIAETLAAALDERMDGAGGAPRR